MLSSTMKEKTVCHANLVDKSHMWLACVGAVEIHYIRTFSS